MAKKKKLNNMQKKFCDEYLLCMNGASAARRAGYSKKTARTQASKLLTKDDILARIEKRRKNEEELLQFSRLTLLNDLLETSQRCMQKVPVMVFDKLQNKMVQKTISKLDEETGELTFDGVWEFDSRATIAAIAEINKMQGHHSPTKIQDVSESPISNLAKKLFGSGEN